MDADLRICVFYLCHCLCITEGHLHGASEKATTRPKFAEDGVRWLELKTSVAMLLWNILRLVMSDFDAHQDVKAAGSLIRTAAIACLIHTKWGERGASLRASLQNLKKALIGILTDPFLHPLSFAPEVPQQTFALLVSLCAEHRHLTAFLVDMVADMLALEPLAGISFLSRVVNGIRDHFNAAVKGEKVVQLYDEVELAMTIISDFAVRKDALVIIGLYLGHLLPVLQSDRTAIRKCFLDVIGGSLAQYHLLSSNDQEALHTLYPFLMSDRDATCRLKALTYVGTHLIENHFIDTKTLYSFVLLVLKRVLDKSKIVRLKALQNLEAFLLNVPVSTTSQGLVAPNLPSYLQSELVSKVSKLLISSESPHSCRDTIEAAGNVLCSACLRRPTLELLDVLIGSEHSSASLPTISKVLHSQLYGYEQWIHFLATRSEASIITLKNFLFDSLHEQKVIADRYYDMVNKAYMGLQGQAVQQLNESMLLGSLRLIAVLMSLDIITVPKFQKLPTTIIAILDKYIKDVQAAGGGNNGKCIIKWILKALSAISKNNEKILTKEMRQFLEDKIIYFYTEGIEGCVDCIYSMKNPHGLTKKILQVYEDELRVLDAPQPLKLLCGYILFIGDLSRSYDFTCHAFIKRLREAQKQISGAFTSDGTFSDYDYLQQEEQKAQEEDAVLRFAGMLLDGDSVPGCYVPFLQKLALTDTAPACLRVPAIQSLGNYMLASNNLAEKYKNTVEMLLQNEDSQIKHSALYLAEKLILAFPNDYVSVLTLTLSLVKDDMVKDAAFIVYANLVLEKKFKLDVLLGPICDGLCDENEKIRHIAIFLLKKLVQEAGRSKYKLIISLCNNCTNSEVHKKLVRVLVENILDATDLQSDELASLVLQILVLGQSDVAFLASFLHPSNRVLQTLHSYLSSCPPRIDLKGNSEATKYLVQFVRNCKRQQVNVPDKEVVGGLLEQLQAKATRKRKSQTTSLKAESTYNSIEEYEKAVESFKQCDISSSLWELLRDDMR